MRRSGSLVGVVLAVVAMTRPAAAEAAVIQTVGGGTGIAAPATGVGLHPGKGAFDAQGNFYVADSGQGVIWRVTPGGTASIVAGDGLPCPMEETNLVDDACRGEAAGDGGPATEAHLTSPDDLVIAPDGDLYFTEARAHDVRRVDAQTGVISTVAGAAGYGDYSPDQEGASALDATLSFPSDLAMDGGGNLFVADWGHGRVRRVAPDGTITTVAGCGEYRWPECQHLGDGSPIEGTYIGYPQAIAVGPDDALYLAANAGIVRVDMEQGVYRLVGGEPFEYAEDAGQGEGGPVAEARFGIIGDLAFGPDGSLAILDARWQRVQRVDAPVTPLSRLRHVAGCYCGPFDPYWWNAGFSGDGGDAKKAAFAFSRESTWTDGGIAFDPSGSVYVSDIGNNRVRRVDRTSGMVQTVVGNGGGGPYASLYMPYSFQSYDRTTGGLAGDGGHVSGAQFAGPSDLAADAAGNVYVLDRLNSRVRRIAADGTIATVVGARECRWGCNRDAVTGDGGPATQAVLYGPSAIALNAGGTLLAIADTFHERVRVANLGATPATLYPGAASGSVTIAPGAIATVFGGGPSCYALQPDCGEARTAVGASVGLIQGVAFDAAGSLFVSDSFLSQVRKADASTGLVTTVAGVQFTTDCAGRGSEGLPGRATRLCGPTSLAIGKDGALYVSEVGDYAPLGLLTYNTSRIRRIDVGLPSYLSTVVAGTGLPGYGGDGGPARDAQLALPRGIAFGSDGSMYIADTGNGRIRRVAPNGTISTVAGHGDFTPPGGFIGYPKDAAGCGALGDGGPATEASLCAPLGLAFGPGGVLYVGDNRNNRIRTVAGV